MTGRAGLLPPLIVLAAFFLPSPEISKQKAPSFVIVQQARSLGSGAHIGQGRILTAAHVVPEGSGVLTVEDQSGNKHEASLTFIDTENDIAVLQIDPRANMESVSIVCRTPRIGEYVETVGNPYGVEFVRMSGRIAGKARPRHGMPTVVVMDMTTIPGMSGGAVLDRRGYLVATVSAVMVQPMFNTPLAVGYAVPSSAFCPLLKNAGVL